jgi:hypothetical protein
MKEEIEAGKLAYAGAIGSKVNLINPFSLAYGPGSARAARVIKDSTKKPDTLSQLKKLLKDEDDKSGDKDKDAAKPAAPAPAPATPPGGTP